MEATESQGAMLIKGAGGFVESNYSTKTRLKSIARIELTSRAAANAIKRT